MISEAKCNYHGLSSKLLPTHPKDVGKRVNTANHFFPSIRVQVEFEPVYNFVVW